MALTRKNALFAGNEIGAENWAMLASLVATCKMSDTNRYCNLTSGNSLELGAMSPCWGAPQQGLPILVFHGVANQPWRRANGQTERYGG